MSGHLPSGSINAGYLMRLEVNGYPEAHPVQVPAWESSEVFEDITIYGVIQRESFALTPNRPHTVRNPKRTKF